MAVTEEGIINPWLHQVFIFICFCIIIAVLSEVSAPQPTKIMLGGDGDAREG